MRRTSLIVLSFAVLAATVAAAAEPTATLRKDRLAATFGGRGLVAIDWDGARFAVPTDEFSAAIGGQAYDSRSLGVPNRVAGKDRVTYEWAAGPYRVTVTYELQPAWGFVSKQLSIAGPAGRPFRVDEVAVVRATLGEAVTDTYVPKGARPNLGTGDYGVCLRLNDRRGLLVVVQNPFLQVELGSVTPAGGDRRGSQTFTIRYRPEMDWNPADGSFVTDRALVGPYRATARRLPAKMLPEWNLGPNDSGPGMDEAEVAAFTEMVRAFVLAKPARPVNVFVPWCLNDYQIDVATPEGRAEYKRILDSGAALGAEYVIFAPTNSDLARREDSADDWSWENLLWLGFGQKIRRNEWNVKTGPVPASVQEMLDHAKSRNLKLLAYVYPVLPFSQNPAWLVSPKDNPGRRYANLGIRAFQDWLIDTLVAFHDRFGLGGYSFDHTFLDYPGASRYAQWAGWRRVMEQLRRRVPDIVIDGRQAYHLYGPWGWLAGSYPHPTFNDEQPESFVPFPDLHFDRVSADRERYTAYRYRNYEFAPSELVPGFTTHQTSRGYDTGEMPEKKTDKGVMLLPFRQRDWDYLGWRYSLLSSIAIAGWNNVLDMIPARDPAEHAAFSEADRKWFRGWIDWTAANKEYLRHTRTILGQPAIGKVDGTSAIVGDRGFIFLFNPNGRRLPGTFRLDDTIGFAGKGAYLLKELYPRPGRLIGKTPTTGWREGEEVSVTLDGGSATVFELQKAPSSITVPLVPADASRGATGAGRGEPFRQYQQIGEYDPAFAGGPWKGTFAVPQRIFEQLAARQKAWPIPWTSEDYRTTWLAPQRLLLFVQIAEPDDQWEATLRIDGRLVELKKAYSAVRAARRTFVGFYADLSLIAPDVPHAIELDLPKLKPGQLQGVFFENVEDDKQGGAADPP
jgi:hypothetical protein